MTVFWLFGLPNLYDFRFLLKEVKQMFETKDITPFEVVQLRLIKAQWYMDLLAFESAVKELTSAEELLEGEKYKSVPHGWHLYAEVK